MFGANGSGAVCCQYGTGDKGKNAGLQLERSEKTLPGAREVPFPMISPFRPVRKTRSPVTGINAWPNAGLGALGLPWGDFDPGFPSTPPIVSRPGGGGGTGGTLATIFQGIASILPSTISAFKGQPYYNTSQPFAPGVSSYPGGAAVTSQNPVAPEGYYYDQSGALKKLGAGLGSGLGDIAQSLTTFVVENPLIILGGATAVYLLFREPPRRRNPKRRRAARRRR